MASLSSCPTEVRDIIYEHCLVVNIEINPYPGDHELATKEFQDSKSRYPSPALLAVNKLVGAEARQVLYGKNCWRMNCNRPIDNIFVCHFRLFRKVTMVFDQRDVSDKYKISVYKETHAIPEADWDVLDKAAAKARHVHRSCRDKAAEQWLRNGDLLLMWDTAYTKVCITVDLENFYCPSGCCRLKLLRRRGLFREMVLANLRPQRPDRPPVILIKGLLNEEERALFRNNDRFAPMEEKDNDGEAT